MAVASQLGWSRAIIASKLAPMIEAADLLDSFATTINDGELNTPSGLAVHGVATCLH